MINKIPPPVKLVKKYLSKVIIVWWWPVRDHFSIATVGLLAYYVSSDTFRYVAFSIMRNFKMMFLFYFVHTPGIKFDYYYWLLYLLICIKIFHLWHSVSIKSVPFFLLFALPTHIRVLEKVSYFSSDLHFYRWCRGGGNHTILILSACTFTFILK